MTTVTLPVSAANLATLKSGGSVTLLGPNPATVTPPSTQFGVTVKNGKLYYLSGKVFQPKGINCSAMEYSSIGGTKDPWSGWTPNWKLAKALGYNYARICFNAASILGLMVADYNNNNGVETWSNERNADPFGNYWSTFVQSTNDAIAAGLIVALDMHWTAPAFTLSNGKQYLAPVGQSPYCDQDTSKDAWLKAIGEFGQNPAVILEFFNEPFIDDEMLWSGGAAVYSAAGGSLTNAAQGLAMKNNGSATSFLQNNGRRINHPWNVYGAQNFINDARGAGSINVCEFNGGGFASRMSLVPYYMPTDPLNQSIAGMHCYCGAGTWPYSNGQMYVSTSQDPGDSTAAWAGPLLAILKSGIFVMISELGGSVGSQIPTAAIGEPYIKQIQQLADEYPGQVGVIPWQFNEPAQYGGQNLLSTQWVCLQFEADGVTMVPSPGEGTQMAGWTPAAVLAGL